MHSDEAARETLLEVRMENLFKNSGAAMVRSLWSFPAGFLPKAFAIAQCKLESIVKLRLVASPLPW